MPTVNGKQYPYTAAGKAAAKKAAAKKTGTKTSYLGNIKKELSDRSKASSKFSKANYEARYGVMGVKQPGSQARASAASKGLTNATGQLFGAVLQGRRYDASGKQIVAGKGASARRTTQSTSRTRTTRGAVPAIQPKGVKVGPKTLPGIIKKGEVKPRRRGTPAGKKMM